MEHSMLYRMLTGGLWLKFYTGEWSRCSWAEGREGYIMNPHDGGMFHISFNGIIEIEDYLYGHNNGKENRLMRLLRKWGKTCTRK